METIYKLYNGITSYVHYLSHLLGDEKVDSKKITKKDNIKFAKLVTIQNFFLLDRKEVIDNKGSLAFYSKVINTYLEEVIRLILPKTKTGLYLLGGEKVKLDRAISILRNKFANGEFYLNSLHDVVVLDTKPVETRIAFKTLESLFNVVAKGLVDYNKKDYAERIIIQNSLNNSKIIRTEAELRRLLTNIVMRKYNIKSIKSEKIDEDTLNEFYQMVAVINQYLKLDKPLYEVLEDYKESLSKKGIRLEETKYKISLNEINLIINMLNQDKSFYEVDDYNIQKNRINEFIIAIKSPEYNGSSFLVENAKNFIMMNDLSNIDRISMDEFLVSIISEFLVLYRPLLKDSFKEFDFSSLDLSRFKFINRITSSSIIELKKQEYIGYQNGKNASIEELSRYKEEYVDAKTEEEKEYIFTKLTLKTREIKEISGILDTLNSELTYLCNTNLNSIDNKIIIEGIKNAIIYGKVSIRKSLLPTNNINDYVINFKYTDDNNVPFELNITVGDFLTLFHEYNVNAIDKYFNSLEKAKKKVRK